MLYFFLLFLFVGALVWAYIALTNKEDRPLTVTREPTTHDFSSGMWGDHFSVDEIQKDGTRISGWGHTRKPLREGDYILLKAANGQSTRYQLTSLRWAENPRDMFFAEASFAPRPVKVEI